MAIGIWRRLSYTLLLVITGLSSAIFITINAFFLFKWSIKPALVKLVGLSASKIMHNYLQLMAYLELPWVKTLKLDDFPFSVHGLEHMAEVKHLFMFNTGLMIISIIGTIWFFRFLSKTKGWWQILGGLQNALVITPLIAFFASVNFDHWFIIFHQIFFRNNYWIFDAKQDPIINVLPDQFFIICMISILIIFELYLVIVFWVAKKQVN
jgi:integral membrane protein (TIGR01906 family)